jgi:prepilin-type N-terminal cleavage/methylation domain-containing protein
MIGQGYTGAYTRSTRGFTLVELLVVLAIGTMLLSLTLPVGLRFYQTQVVDEATTDMVLDLRRASAEARAGRGGTAFGVRYFSDRYVTFVGDSYETRDSLRERIVTLPASGVITASPEEFVFAHFSGVVNATGTVTLSLFGVTRVVAVGELGAVSVVE